MRARLLAIAAVACEASQPAPPPAPPARCERAFADKLGVPFVRVCPADLPGVVSAPFWIAAAPIGCTGGEHETIACPPIVALAPSREHVAIEHRTAQLTDAEHAHRTCTLRFGGRLPTTAERAQARDAVGLATVLVTDDDAGARHLATIPEWTTTNACTAPTTLATTCAIDRFPPDTSAAVPWESARACRATPVTAERALAIRSGESCPVTPPPGGPPCVITNGHAKFSLDCRPLRDAERTHPETTVERAAIRCVVPEGALAGTIIR